ncbi:class I adenylate-forming enzyme family protein [Streptomyces sp. NPDC046909]|uniref:class I adenylate-forming enzyme family protein n=1 Tax=Streptomyces sp. NPDC046909 TaxID=3155617 RepID=UPI0033EACFB2
MQQRHAPSPYGNYAHAVVTAGARRHPDRIAVTYEGRLHLTYAELDARVNRRANALKRAGIGTGDRVAVLLQGTLGITETYLALAKVGATLVALNPYWSADVTTTLVERSACTAFVRDGVFDALAADIAPKLPRVTCWLRLGGADADAIDLDRLTDEASDEAPEPGAHHDDELALFFTSGTTGLPKAVVHTHASALATAQQWLDVPHDDESAFGTGPIIWGVGYFAIAGPALYAGMRLVLEDDFGPDRFLEAVPAQKITHISVIPSFFSQLFATEEQTGADLTSLRVILLGGEPLLPSLRRRILERLPGVALCSYYGQTEAPYTVVGRQHDGSQDVRSSGRARTGCAVQVVDSEGRRLVNAVGDVWLTGPHLMRGYDGDTERTAEVLRDGWYVGGDIGILDDAGTLTVLGRRQDAIRRATRYVLPGEVEDAALGVDGVVEAGAVGVPEDADRQRILLAVQVRPGGELDARAVEKELADRLPEEARPDAILVTEALPHAQDSSGGRGKLLRREIRERWGYLVSDQAERAER